MLTVCKSALETCVKSTEGHSNTAKIINTWIKYHGLKKKCKGGNFYSDYWRSA